MEEKIQLNYMVIKIGKQVYSTEHFCRPKHKYDFRRSVDKENIWIKGFFTETKGHKPIEPIPFELNIYIGEGEK